MELSRRWFLKAGAATAAGIAAVPLNGFASIDTACGNTTWDLTAGQTIKAGTVTVSNDFENIYITYKLDTVTYPNAVFGTLHVWVGTDLLLVPTNNQGIPVPGQFPYKYDATGLNEYTFTIPFASLNLPDIKNYCTTGGTGLKVFVVTHAEVDLNGGGPGGGETAFGGPDPGTGPRWWFYGQYTICCDVKPDNPDLKCSTAYGRLKLDGYNADGPNYVWTTDPKSNPEVMPSLNLTQNRWGWAINLKERGSYIGKIYAGAGLNNISKAKLAGKLYVEWVGDKITVTYEMFTTSTLPNNPSAVKAVITEVHVYASNTPPTTIAPGQYPHIDYVDKKKSYEVTLDLPADSSEAWIVAHAVVCY